MRVAVRRRFPEPPRALWRRLATVRGWATLLSYPDRPDVRRVKVEGGGAPREDARVQVLYADKSWEVLRIAHWAPERQVRLVAETAGHGDQDGSPVRPARSERLILIPQGDGAEAEWTIDVGGGLTTVVGRVTGADEAWGLVLDKRLDALGGNRPEASA